MDKKENKTQPVNFLALESYQEYIGLSSMPAANIFKLRKHFPQPATKMSHDGETVLIQPISTDTTPRQI